MLRLDGLLAGFTEEGLQQSQSSSAHNSGIGIGRRSDADPLCQRMFSRTAGRTMLLQSMVSIEEKGMGSGRWPALTVVTSFGAALLVWTLAMGQSQPSQDPPPSQDIGGEFKQTTLKSHRILPIPIVDHHPARDAKILMRSGLKNVDTDFPNSNPTGSGLPPAASMAFRAIV